MTKKTFKFRDNIERMHGYTPGFQPTDRSAIKINTNENPYPPSPRVMEALAKIDGEAMRRYPQVSCDEFRQKAAKLHGIEADMILCGNGADELLSLLVRCCCDSNRRLAYPVPTYSLYPVLAAIQDCPTVEVPFEGDFRIPEELYHTEAALTILCNPNAPSGTFIGVDEVGVLAETVSGVLAVDEAYVDFAETNCLELLKKFDNVVILRSMSKGYSLAGMRLGYAIGSRRIIEAMIKVKDSYNVNVVTQVAATAAIADQEYFRQNVTRIVNERRRLTAELGGLGFSVTPSQTNFILVQITEPPAQEIYEKLTRQNIYIRYWQQQDLKDKLRISVGTHDQNDALLQAFKEILG